MKWCNRCEALRVDDDGTCVACGHEDFAEQIPTQHLTERQRHRARLKLADARRLADEITKACRQIDAGWIYVAKRLDIFDRARGWEALGYASMQAWMGDSGLPLTVGRGARILRVYRYYVQDLGLPEQQVADIPPSRLERVKTPITDGRLTPDEAIEEARVFTADELGQGYHNPTPRPLVDALRAIRRYRPPDKPGHRLVIAVLDEPAYQHLMATGQLVQRVDGLHDMQLSILGTEATLLNPHPGNRSEAQEAADAA